MICNGQTEWDVQKRIEGSENDSPLTDIGKLQAKLTGIYINSHQNINKFDIIFSSPLGRALITSSIIAEQINYSTNNILIDNDLNEIKEGLFSGLIYEEWKNDNKLNLFIELYERLQYMKDRNPLRALEIRERILREGSDKLYKELTSELGNRIARFWNKIINASYSKIIIVSHRELLNAFNKYLSHCMDIDESNITNELNCTIQYIRIINNKYKICTLPNTIHLESTVDWSNIEILNILNKSEFGIKYIVKVHNLAKWGNQNIVILKSITINKNEYENFQTSYSLNREIVFYQFIDNLSSNDMSFFSKMFAYRKYECSVITGYCADIITDKKDGTVEKILQEYFVYSNGHNNDITIKQTIISIFTQAIYAIYLMHNNTFYHFQTTANNIYHTKTNDEFIELGKLGKIKSFNEQISLINYKNVISEQYLLNEKEITLLFINRRYNIDLWLLIDSIVLNNEQLYKLIDSQKINIEVQELFNIMKIMIKKKYQYNFITLIRKLQQIDSDNFSDTKIDQIKILLNNNNVDAFKKSLTFITIGYEILQMFQILYPNEYIRILEIIFNKSLQFIKYIVPIFDVDVIIMIKENYNNLEKIIKNIIDIFFK